MLAVVIILGSCAQNYYYIQPPKLNYTASNDLQDVKLNYRYDVLREAGNKKISKRERKNKLKLVAVRITNNTDKIINIGDNAAFYSGNTAIYPIDAISLKFSLKQSIPAYLLYLLMSPVTLSINYSKPIPIGLIAGPIIAGGNMLTASRANNKMYNELVQYDIMHLNIPPGETVYGLVGFRNIDYAPLTVKLIK